MSASEGSWGRVSWRCRFVLSLSLFAAAAFAQTPAPRPDNPTFPVGAQARGALARIQVDWLDWVVACNDADGARADAVVENLLSRTRLLGMERVPALSVAAALRAVEFAEAGDLERARCGLAAAERLDPRRPEAAFAEARVAALQGNYLSAAGRYVGGLRRALEAPQTRVILLNNAGVWATTVLSLSGLLLVGVFMFSRGTQLYLDLFRYFSRFVPAVASHLLSLVLLSWPLLLPAGVLWTAIYWSVLLWPYGGRFERALLIGIWLFIGSLPTLLAEQNRRVGLALFAPVQSIESASRGELEGDLFSQLSLLASILPESPALAHFGADIHRKMSQMENARALYRRVLTVESENAAALNGLGIYYFHVSDFGQAVEHFSRALASDASHAEIHFNLSQTYSELYRFGESERSLRLARELDSDAVSRWLQDETRRTVPLDGGLRRVADIRSELRAQWRVREEVPGWLSHWRRTLSLPLVAVFLGISIAVRLLTRRGPLAKPVEGWWGSRVDRVRRALLAGVPEAEGGHPGRAAIAVLVMVALGALPLIGSVGYSVPWLRGPSTNSLVGVSVVGLLLFLGLRYWNEGRDRL